MRRSVVLLAAALTLAAYREKPETQPQSIAVTARAVPLDPTDPAYDRVGRLRYVGGLELASRDRRFGGISGMRFLPDGRLLAVSDEGSWITLTLTERDGRPVGVAAATVARLSDRSGRPLRAKQEADAEALELEADGSRLVAFEHDHRVWRYDEDGARPRPVPFPDPMWLGRLTPNSGIEAMAHVGELTLYLAEEPGANAYNGLLQGGGRLSAMYGRLAYTPPPGFKPTDAVALDEAHVLVLNRRYSPLMGVAAALTVVPVASAHLALGKPELLAELAAPLTVDNMEALDIRRAGGRTFVWMASDDNFSPLQRTLLLKFELLPGTTR